MRETPLLTFVRTMRNQERFASQLKTLLGSEVTEDVRWTDSRVPDANQHLALAHLLHKLRPVQPPEVRHTLNMARCLPV